MAPLLLGSALVLEWLNSDTHLPEILFQRRWIAIQAILLTAFYLWLGIHTSTLWGEHSGDEGHYLCQAASLMKDGDLDIQNNTGAVPQEVVFQMLKDYGEPQEEGTEAYDKCMRRLREHMHVSTSSKHGEWHSLHLPGLSLLLARGTIRECPIDNLSWPCFPA